MSEAGFKVDIRPSSKAANINDRTNYIWCGEEVPKDLVRYIALKAMQAGFELFGVSGFPERTAKTKSTTIEIGAVVPEPGRFAIAADLQSISCKPF